MACRSLADPLPIGQVKMKSYLPRRRIYLSQTTGQHLFQALMMIINILFTDSISFIGYQLCELFTHPNNFHLLIILLIFLSGARIRGDVDKNPIKIQPI